MAAMTEIPSSVLILRLPHLFLGEDGFLSGARLVQSPFSPTGPRVNSHHTRKHTHTKKSANWTQSPLFQAETWTREHIHGGVTET